MYAIFVIIEAGAALAPPQKEAAPAPQQGISRNLASNINSARRINRTLTFRPPIACFNIEYQNRKLLKKLKFLLFKDFI